MLGSNELGFINFPLIHTHHKVKVSLAAHQWEQGVSTQQLEYVSDRHRKAHYILIWLFFSGALIHLLSKWRHFKVNLLQHWRRSTLYGNFERENKMSLYFIDRKSQRLLKNSLKLKTALYVLINIRGLLFYLDGRNTFGFFYSHILKIKVYNFIMVHAHAPLPPPFCAESIFYSTKKST